MRVDDLDAPSGEFFPRAHLHVASRGPNWVFHVNAYASDALDAYVFATSADGTDLGKHAVFSDLSPPLHDDNAPHPCSVETPASTTVVFDKEALGAIPLALPIHKHSVERPTDLRPQAPSAVFYSPSRVTGTNRAHLSLIHI